MFSISNLVKRVGVGGRLVAFFKAVCVYFAVGGGEGEGGANNGGRQGVSAAGVAAKCAPIICLLLIVAAHQQNTISRRYGILICIGLALSCVGDALLAVADGTGGPGAEAESGPTTPVWYSRLEPGMAAFGAAHIAYLAAFGTRNAAPKAAIAISVLTALYVSVLWGGTAGWLRVCVPIYGAVLGAMCWRGVARGGAAQWGALLFLISDAALGYHMFVQPLLYPRAIVMSTYYMAQFGIALSALEPLSAPTSYTSAPTTHTSAPTTPISGH